MNKNTYGLTADDLQQMRDKIDKQRNYLENNHFHTATGQVKSLLDVSFSANMSERYYAQLSNKINTMADLAFNEGLKPVFLTITLDGFFRGFLKSDYRKWDKLNAISKIDYERHIPNNEIYGFLREKIKEGKKFTVKDCYNTLSYQWYRFSAGYAFKKLKKEGKDFVYLKASEPHKDGVPHFHVLLWIPEEHFSTFKKDFERYFPAPQNHVKSTDVDSNPDDTKGFQTAIYNPVGYIMKYATKSFMDIKNNDELDYLQAWYVKHKIRRITTSHSTVPQWVYQKVFTIEKSWLHITALKRSQPLLCEWNKEDDHFMFIEQSGRCLQYDQGVLTLSYINSNIIIRQTGELKEQRDKTPRSILNVPSTWQNPHTPNKTIDTYIDGEHFLYRDGEIFNFTPQPVRMSDFELWNYYHEEMDMDTVNHHHFVHVRNECIKRGLVKGDELSLNVFTREYFEASVMDSYDF